MNKSWGRYVQRFDREHRRKIRGFLFVEILPFENFNQSCVSKNIPENIFWKVARLAIGWRGVCKWDLWKGGDIPPHNFFCISIFLYFVFCVFVFSYFCIFVFLYGIVECGSEIYVKVEMSLLITRLHPAMRPITLPHTISKALSPLFSYSFTLLLRNLTISKTPYEYVPCSHIARMKKSKQRLDNFCANIWLRDLKP